MAGVTDIQTFALSPGANVLTPAAYKLLHTLIANGYETGTALSIQLNTTWRQSSFMAAGLANFITAQGIDVPDDGNLAALVFEIEAAFLTFMSNTFGSLPLYRKTVTLNINTANNGNYNLIAQVVNFPSIISPVILFRVKAHVRLTGGTFGAGGSYLQQNYTLAITDGTTTISGAPFLVYSQTGTGIAVGIADDFYFPTSYVPGDSATFTASVSTLGGGSGTWQLNLTQAELDIQVENA